MSQMTYSPFVLVDPSKQPLNDLQNQASKQLSQTVYQTANQSQSRMIGSFDSTSKPTVTLKFIDTSLPQNQHTLINRKFNNETEHTYVVLRNCLNMKEF